MTVYFPEDKLKDQLVERGIRNPEVLRAIRVVPREEFVNPESRGIAYEDRPIPIGYGQTISQPYIVALMTELADVARGDRVLEVGTGCGYQTAVLAQLADQVYSVEIVAELSARAEKVLDAVGVSNVQLRVCDGWEGWPEKAPFDVILVAAAPPEIPPRLIEQLAEGGRLVIPVGEDRQVLKLLVKENGDLVEKRNFAVRFVPLVKNPTSIA